MNKKILVIEDKVSTPGLERDNIEICGYDVIIERVGKEGLLNCITESTNLLVLDLSLISINIYYLFYKIREFKNVPILIVSPDKGTSHKRLTPSLIFDVHMIKTFNPSDLISRVKEYIEAYEKYSNQLEITNCKDKYMIRSVYLISNDWLIKFI